MAVLLLCDIAFLYRLLSPAACVRPAAHCACAVTVRLRDARHFSEHRADSVTHAQIKEPSVLH